MFLLARKCGHAHTLLSASNGKYLSFCACVPYVRKTVFTSVLCTSHKTETEGSTFASSSIAMIADVKEDSAPPWSAAVSIPISLLHIIFSRTPVIVILVTYALFKETLDHCRIHILIFVHFADSRADNLICESAH